MLHENSGSIVTNYEQQHGQTFLSAKPVQIARSACDPRIARVECGDVRRDPSITFAWGEEQFRCGAPRDSCRKFPTLQTQAECKM